MLAYILALVVGLSSVALYMAAFFFPEVHRKHDFLWSGLGLFYALVLWVCAGRITGGVLLGQTASVVLLGWLGWQVLTLRHQIAPVEQQTAVPTAAEWQVALSQLWTGLSSSRSIAPIAQPIGKQVSKLTAWMEALVATTTTPAAPPANVEPTPYVPLTPADFANASRDAVPPAKTSVADDPSVQPGGNVQSQENSLTAIAKQAQNTFKGLTTKRESKPVYVRKQFRSPEPEPQTAMGASATKASGTQPSSIAAPESLAPAPPPLEEPPTVETIAAGIAGVEAKDLTVSPLHPVEAEPASEADPLA